MQRPFFPTDVSIEDFEQVRDLLDGARKITRPKLHSTYDVFCAILFVIRNDAAWRSLPQSFPPWRSVHHHFVQWTSPTTPETPLEVALRRLQLLDVAFKVRAQIKSRSAPLL